MTAKLGSVLTDDKGMTLYTLTKDGQAVVCTGACASAWPPLLVPAGTVTKLADSGVKGVATDGTQVTVNGLAVYRFSGDAAAGDTNGNGLASFGGVWHVAAATSSATDGTTVTTAAPVTTAPAYGSGY